ncbi:DUF4166 domain-containing protein [Methylomagnum sp.]
MPASSLPLLRLALGDDAWHRLAPVIRRHYDISPLDGTPKVLRGVMEEIFHAPIIKPWLALARSFEALVPYQGRDVPTEARNWTDPAQPDALFWHRTFHFPDGRQTVFSSRMEAGGNGELVEYLRFGVGIRMAVSERDGALVFTGRDHCWRVGSVVAGIPNWALLGDASIVESAVSEDELRVDFEIVHPVFGRTFGYRGKFGLEL